MNWKQSIDSQANLSTIPLSRANGGELFILDNNTLKEWVNCNKNLIVWIHSNLLIKTE